MLQHSYPDLYSIISRNRGDDQILAKELCTRILNARTWREALHYRGQAVRLGQINISVDELEGLTPADSYKAVDQMLNSCLWTNGSYIVWSVDGQVQGLTGKLAADLSEEGWARVVDPEKELEVSPQKINETTVMGYVSVKELRDG